jgi:hypothetical protein
MFSCCGAKSVNDKNLDMSGKNVPEQKTRTSKQAGAKIVSAPAPKATKEVKSLHKWAKGAVARRRFKKFVQVKSIADSKKPVYSDGKLSKTKEVLLKDEELANCLSAKTGGKGLYWNTRSLDIKNGRTYTGQWTAV